MNNLFDFIIIIVLAFIGSVIAVVTRGDGENIVVKVIIGTVLGTIFLCILRVYY